MTEGLPAVEDSGPVVGRPAGGPGLIFAVSIFAVIAVALFVFLNSRRVEQPRAAVLTAPVADAIPSLPEPALQLPPPPPPPPPVVAPAPAVAAAPVFTPPSPVSLASTPAADPLQRRRAPAVVVDLGSQGAARVVQTAAAGTAQAAPVGQAAEPTNEAFAVQVGAAQTERALATPMANPGAIIPQGAMIPAVLETAINSDLPGYTRAVVSRDVRSFDGRYVLIPRGSRLIGQYKSAMALGASRAFVIWTRVIRPDGVSVQIASPGTDALGRGGLSGEVDRHFFNRFGGSILLSVLNAGVAAVGKGSSTQIAIGSPGAAASMAGAAMQGDAIPPTVKVAQGEPVQIFVARDLDFSAVGPAR